MHLLIFSNEKKKISSKLKRRRNVFSTCLINSNDWSDLQRCILVCFRICGDKKISKAGVEEDIQEIRIKGDGLHREPRKNDISSIRSYPNHSVVFISFLSFCLFFGFFFSFLIICTTSDAFFQEEERTTKRFQWVSDWGEQTFIDHPLHPAAFTEKDDAAHTTT